MLQRAEIESILRLIKIILIAIKCAGITEDLKMNESLLSKEYHDNWEDLITTSKWLDVMKSEGNNIRNVQIPIQRTTQNMIYT